MPKAAIISDIHANLEALTAVLDDIRGQGIEDVFCLGDIVGYGPDPVACTDRVRETCRATVCGNHDEALIKGAWGFTPHARQAIDWTRKVMKPGLLRWSGRARWRFLETLPLTHTWEGYLLVHGSPRNPVSEYILPRDVEWPQPGKFEEVFQSFSTVCFVGHTHIPGVFHEGPVFHRQPELPETFGYEGGKMLINVGSVGQPRDGDPRSSYLIVEDGRFRFRRVEYPWQTTRDKIRAIPELDDRLGDRLGTGD